MNVHDQTSELVGFFGSAVGLFMGLLLLFLAVCAVVMPLAVLMIHSTLRRMEADAKNNAATAVQQRQVLVNDMRALKLAIQATSADGLKHQAHHLDRLSEIARALRGAEIER